MLAILAATAFLAHVPHHVPTRVGSSHGRHGQEGTADKKATFEARRAELTELLGRRSWEDAETGLLELLSAHSGAPYVLPYLENLRQDLRRATFWKSVDEPDAAALVAGKLLRYKFSSGSIKLRLDHTSLGDCTHVGPAYVHPLHFEGAWSLELEGTAEELACPTIVLEISPEESYVVRFGNRVEGEGLYTNHVIEHVQGETRRRLLSESPKEIKKKSVGRKVEALIKLGKKRLEVSYGRKRLGKIERESEGFGSLALVSEEPGGFTRSFGDLTLDGEAQKGWVGGLMDAAVAEQRKAFEATWKDPEVFATWKASDDEYQDLTLQSMLARLEFRFKFNAKQLDLYERFQKVMGKSRPQARGNLRQLGEFPEGALTPSALAVLKLKCALELDRPLLAIDQLDAIDVQPKQELDFELLRGLLLNRGGKLDEAERRLEALAKLHPEVSLAHTLLADTLLLLDRPVDARAAIVRGLKTLPASTALHEMETKVVKADKGPLWERTREFEGRHFVVRTDGDRSLARATCKVFDEAFARCEEFFGPLPDGALPPKSEWPHSEGYLFAGESSYLSYVRGVSEEGHENTLGVYSILLDQIAVWNQPDSRQLWDVIRHEVAHRYLDLALGQRIPRWLNEGYAEAFAASWGASGEFSPGELRSIALYTFSSGAKLQSLGAFVDLSDEEFMALGEVGYAEAWAVVHFLRFVEPKGPAILERVQAQLLKGADPSHAITLGFEGEDLNGLSRSFLKWLRKELSSRR